MPVHSLRHAVQAGVFDLALIRLAYLHLMTNEQLNVVRAGDVWQLSGPGAERYGLVK